MFAAPDHGPESPAVSPDDVGPATFLEGLVRIGGALPALLVLAVVSALAPTRSRRAVPIARRGWQLIVRRPGDVGRRGPPQLRFA
jgi:hypothetical protein